MTELLAAAPRRHDDEDDAAEHEREPAAMLHLVRVRGEEGEVDEQEQQADHEQPPRQFHRRRNTIQQHRVDRHRADDGDAVGRARLSEERKPSTTASVIIMSMRLIHGR
jgi:hypothetical protein